MVFAIDSTPRQWSPSLRVNCNGGKLRLAGPWISRQALHIFDE